MNIVLNKNPKYFAFNGNKKQYLKAMCNRANNGKPNLGKLISKVSVEKWQYTDADKKAIAAGTKKPEECKKVVYAACGETRKIYERSPQIPVASKTLRDEVAKAYADSKDKHTTLPKNWIPKQEPKKPWTKVDALHALAMYRLSKWDKINPAPDKNAIDEDDESTILTYNKHRSDAFSKIVTKIINDDKPKHTYRVLIYGKKDYSLDECETYYFDTFKNLGSAQRAFIDKAIEMKKKHPKNYTRAELTDFSKKHKFGYKVMEFDQRGHMADILHAHKKKIDLTWYTQMNTAKEIPIKKRTTALAA